MTLPSSGTIKLSEVQTEFGGSNPISMSEYYGEDSGIPNSGTISLSDFYGASAAGAVDPVFDAASYSLFNSDNTTNGGAFRTVEVTLTVETDGDLLEIESGTSIGSTTVIGNYDGNGPLTSSNYDIRLDYVSGTNIANTNTWLQINSNRSWQLSVSDNTEQSVQFNGTLRIRERSSGTVIDTASVLMSVNIVTLS